MEQPPQEFPPVFPVLRRRGKLITFLRMFFTHRPARSTLKQNGIVRERVYGCDLGEHLSNTSLHIPQVLKCCCEAIENHGLIDGIYRLTGVASSIQRLRTQFDEGVIETLQDEENLLDLHTITAVLKMYFRELPNPLMTFQLYDSFADAVKSRGEERLEKLKKTVAALPPPHYRCAKRLFRHLHHMSLHQTKTGMDSRNLAIVWAPNLMRCKAMEGGNISGHAMLHNVSIQATVVEALIFNYEHIFSEEAFIPKPDVNNKKPRPQSVAVSSPSRLLSLSEAQDRLSSEVASNSSDNNDEIIPVFHTVIDFNNRKSATGRSANQAVVAAPLANKDRSAPAWRSFFHRNRPATGKKKRTKSADGEEDEGITDNEIGHLSRQLQPSVSTSDLNATVHQGSLPSLLDKDDNAEADVDEPAEENSGLARASSHESFFDPSSPVMSLCEPLTVMEKPKTPGVIYRPAYKREDLDDLMNANVRKATWKSSSSPTKPRSSLPYVSPPASMPPDEVKPLFYTQSPGAQRKLVPCFTSTEDHSHSFGEAADASRQTTSATDSLNLPGATPDNTQADVTSTVSPITASNTDGLDLMAGWTESEALFCVNQAQQARMSRHFSNQSSSSDRSRRHFTDVSTPDVTPTHEYSSTTDELCPLYENVDPSGPAVETTIDLETASSSQKENGTTLSSEGDSGSTMSSQRDSETTLSSHRDSGTTASSHRDSGTTSSSHRDSRMTSSSHRDSGTTSSSHRDSSEPIISVEQSSASWQSDKPRQASVPKQTVSPLVSDQSARPRSNSSPYKAPLYSMRQRETDIDKAIADNHSANQTPLSRSKIIRGSDYVNVISKNRLRPRKRSTDTSETHQEKSLTEALRSDVQTSNPQTSDAGSTNSGPESHYMNVNITSATSSVTDGHERQQKARVAPPIQPRKLSNSHISTPPPEGSQSVRLPSVEHHARLDVTYTNSIPNSLPNSPNQSINASRSTVPSTNNHLLDLL